MTPAELRSEVEKHEAVGLEHLVLVIPRGVRPPWRGELLSETEAAGRVYRFPIRSVRRWLAKNVPICQGCGNEIDPATCGCGSPVKGHGCGEGHAAVPMGCACSYAKGA